MVEQSRIARLLETPTSYGLPADTAIERIDTHASMVFLAGDRAYKLKRAVKYPYLDFSTLDRRRAACAAELRLNRRTAPELYLGACPVLDLPDGRLALGELREDGPQEREAESGHVLDWVVVLKRFPDEALLDRVAKRGGLDAPLLEALAREVAAFHEAAEPVAGGRAPLARVVEENAEEFPQFPELFDAEAVAALDADSRRCLAQVGALLDARGAAGLVRHCHGDLHLRNVVLLDGRPRLFDAIEFDDAIASIDVLYDLAFLLMDLDQRGLRPAANRVLGAYLDRRCDLDGLAAMPLFLSLRAAIRAKVTASALSAGAEGAERGNLMEEARSYFRAAQGYLRPEAPSLVAVGGVSGSGKTTVARLLAPEIGRAPGGLVVRSDVERKRLFGVDELDRLPESAYQGRANAEVYARMLERAERTLRTGQSVVLEATFLRREDRAQARRLAERTGVAFQGLWLTAPAETLKARVAARSGDASDATVEIVEAQLARAPQDEIGWPAVSAEGPPDAVAERARVRLTRGEAAG